MNIIRDILREELNVKFFPGEGLTIDDFEKRYGIKITEPV